MDREIDKNSALPVIPTCLLLIGLDKMRNLRQENFVLWLKRMKNEKKNSFIQQF